MNKSMTTQLIIGTAVAFSGIAILPAIFAALFVLHDINTFQTTIYEELTEFKTFANDAWSTMVPRSGKVLRRFRRDGGYDGNTVLPTTGSNCNCGPRSGNCPAGPPGPPGFPGIAGENGKPGNAGRAGKHGDQQAQLANFDQNVKCPPGPPGPPGLTGAVGSPGIDGQKGIDGINGQQGQRGKQGEVGVQGPSGLPGSSGNRGRNGLNGRRGRGLSGPPGLPGAQGQPGRNGKPGEAGPNGKQGEQGLPGKNGNNGQPGSNGQTGPIGENGSPGSDAAYCPCPPRSAEILQAGANGYDKSSSPVIPTGPTAPPRKSNKLHDYEWPGPKAALSPPKQSSPPAAQPYKYRRM